LNKIIIGVFFIASILNVQLVSANPTNDILEDSFFYSQFIDASGSTIYFDSEAALENGGKADQVEEILSDIERLNSYRVKREAGKCHGKSSFKNESDRWILKYNCCDAKKIVRLLENGVGMLTTTATLASFIKLIAPIQFATNLSSALMKLTANEIKRVSRRCKGIQIIISKDASYPILDFSSQ